MSLGGLVNSDHGNGTVSGSQRTTNAALSIQEKRPPKRQKPLPQLPYQQKSSQPTGVDRILEGLFSSNQQQRSGILKLRYSGTSIAPSPRTSISAIPEENELEILNRMLYTEKASLENLWSQCQKVIQSKARESTAARDSKEHDTSSKRDIFRELLIAICRSRSQEPFRSSLPAPSTVIKTYLKHKLMRYWWDNVLWIQIGVLVDWNHRVIKATRTADVPATENAVRLFNDILGVWEIFLDCHRDQKPILSFQTEPKSSSDHDLSSSLMPSIPVSGSKTIEWRGLPAYTDPKHESANLPADVSHRFVYYLPRHPNNRQISRIAGAAVLTYDCFQSLKANSSLPQSILEYARPFVQFIEHIIRGGKLDRQTSSECLLGQGISLEIVDDLLTGWGPKPATMKESPIPVELPQEKSIVQDNSAWKQSHLISVSKDLTRAIDRSDVGQAITLWRNFVSRPKPNDLKEEELQPVILQFLSAFFNLRRPEQSVEVWNHMVKLGHQPSQKHWHAMILGCANAKDLLSMQGIWANMKAAGFKPDVKSWTTWIHGLIRCGSWQKGLEALDELGILWKKASTVNKGGSDHELLSPSIIPVNAAITALQTTGKANIVPSVLKWAKSQSLPLNISTFNIMLRHLILKGELPTINTLLSSMERHGCAPDIATFTIILNGLVSNPNSSFHDQSPADQKTTILSILRDMEQKGLPANAYTYSTILDGLLSPQTPNLPGARAVLDHMAQHNLKPSPHIYTILSGHYFSTVPPDLAALDALWRATRVAKSVLDSVFYDRMIEGYARIGEVEKMLFFVKRAALEGKSPSWVALAAAMRALRAAREWDLVRDLVVDVQDLEEGVLRHGEGGRTGKDRFWRMVDDMVEEGVIEASSKE